MSVHALSPEESAASARKDLQKAFKALAEAQTAVVQALQTIDMFEHNFRLGHYQETPLDYPGFTVSSSDEAASKGE